MGPLRHFVLLFIVVRSATAFAQADSIRFKTLLVHALQGDMRPVLDSMDKLNNAALPIKQQRMKQMLMQRFRTQDEAYDYHTTDTTVIDVMRIYQRYWAEAMMDNDVKEHDIGLGYRIAEHLRTHVPELRNKKPKWLQAH